MRTVRWVALLSVSKEKFLSLSRRLKWKDWPRAGESLVPSPLNARSLAGAVNLNLVFCHDRGKYKRLLATQTDKRLKI